MSIYYAAYLLRTHPLAPLIALTLARDPARLEHLRHSLERSSVDYIVYEAA